jgi:hypothetical protein
MTRAITFPDWGLGPYASGEEERFKQDVIKLWGITEPHTSSFCIESPGTAPGFPDVIHLTNYGAYRLYEFKVSNARSVIKFEKTQPLFYRKHPYLNVTILAWDVPRKRMVAIGQAVIVNNKSLRYTLPER